MTDKMVKTTIEIEKKKNQELVDHDAKFQNGVASFKVSEGQPRVNGQQAVS